MVMCRAKCLSVADGTDGKLGAREKTAEWDAASEQALTIIGLTITPDQYQYIRTAMTGPEAWTALKNVYEKPSRANRIALKHEFYTTVHDPTAPIRDYTNRITELGNRLSAIGVTLQDTNIVDVLRSSIATTLPAAQGELKVSDVIGALVDEEGCRSVPNPDGPADESALMARSCCTCSSEKHPRRLLRLRTARPHCARPLQTCTACRREHHSRAERHVVLAQQLPRHRVLSGYHNGQLSNENVLIPLRIGLVSTVVVRGPGEWERGSSP